MADLELDSPIDGQIVTWDLRTGWKATPCRKARPCSASPIRKGDWELDLHMPDDRMGFIARAEKLAADGATSRCRSPISWPRSRERR